MSKLVAPVILLVLLVAVTVSQVCQAASDTQTDVRELFEKARRAYTVGRFDEALAGFERAYLQSGDPALLFNLAQTYAKLGRVADAIRFYRQYLRDSPKASNRQVVEARIAELEAQQSSGAAGQPGRPTEPPAAATESEPPRSPSLPATPEPAATAPLAEQAAAEPQPQVPTVAAAGPDVSPPIAPAPVAPPPAAAALPPPPPPAPAIVTAPPVPPPALAPPSMLISAPLPAAAAAPLYTRWWFWTALGVVAAGGVAAAVLVLDKGPSPDQGSISPGVVVVE